MTDFANPHITMAPRKLFSVGAFQRQTAYLREEHYRPIALETLRGVPYVEAKHLPAEVRKLQDMEFQIHCTAMVPRVRICFSTQLRLHKRPTRTAIIATRSFMANSYVMICSKAWRVCALRSVFSLPTFIAGATTIATRSSAPSARLISRPLDPPRQVRV